MTAPQDASNLTGRYNVPDSTLVSLNKPAFSSSVEAGTVTADKAVDGNTATRWSSLYSDPQWIYVDLGTETSIKRVVLNWQTAYASAYSLQVSNDAVNWTTVYSTAAGDGGIDDINGLSASGRYVRMYGTQRATQYGYSLWEFSIYKSNFVSSSVEASSVSADKAFDNNPQTRWASQYSDPQWIYADLGSTKTIKRISLDWEAAYGKSYDIQTSSDAVNWTTIYTTTNGDGGTDDITGLNASARYVRMYGTQRGTPYGYSLWEFNIYGNDSIITQYEYDKDNRPVKTILNNLKSVSNKYDALGRVEKTTVDTATPYITSYNYLAGISTGSTTVKVSSMINAGNSTSYTYDQNGNIETITQGSNVIKYYYNELNELTREDNQVLDKTVVYAYDAGGNLLTKVDYPYTTGTLGTITKTYLYAYGDTNWKDKLTSYDGKAITYDAIGNPLTYDGWTYTWEAGRQLATMSKAGQNLSFKYNDSGIRTQKTVNGVTTKYYLNGDKVTLEDNGTDKIYYNYSATGNLVSMNLNGTEYYYIRNAEGDIIGLFDSAGTQVVSYTYDSWGKLISTTGTLASTVGVKNPYLYRGYRSDSETGLYYLQSRYYSPEWGRFVNADAEGGKVGQLLTHNVFAYCLNNPVNMADPDGNIAWWIVGGAIGAIAGAAYSYATTGSVDWRYVVGGALVGAGLGFLAEAAVGGALASTSIVASSPQLIDKVTKTSERTLDLVKDVQKVNGQYYAGKAIIDKIGVAESRGVDFSQLTRSMVSSRPANFNGNVEGVSRILRYADSKGTRFIIHEVMNGAMNVVHRDFDAVRIFSGQMINKL